MAGIKYLIHITDSKVFFMNDRGKVICYVNLKYFPVEIFCEGLEKAVCDFFKWAKSNDKKDFVDAIIKMRPPEG